MTSQDGVMLSNDLDEAVGLFVDAKRREGVSVETVAVLERGCRSFADWLRANGQPTAMDRVAAGHVEDWEASLRETLPHDVFHDHHRGVQQFLTWYGRQRDLDWRARSAWRRAEVETAKGT